MTSPVSRNGAVVSASQLDARLRAGLDAMGLSLEEEGVERLLAYLDLMGKWNRVYNLTAVRDPLEMLTHHVLDSLSAVQPLRRHLGQTQGQPQLLDVGSGGGLPGVVFAVCQPDLKKEKEEDVGKKAAFVQQVASALQLRNLRGLHARVEQVREVYDVVSSRAFASLADFTAWSQQTVAPQGVWLAMKGRRPDEEMAALPPTVEVFHVEPLQVPQLDAERCIVWMRKKS